MNLTIDSNVQNIIFNGNDVQKLVFNGVEVWSKSNPDPYLQQYFCMEVLDSGYIWFMTSGSSSKRTWYYRKNNATTWSSVQENTGWSSSTSNKITVTAGDKVYLKMNSPYSWSNRNYSYHHWIYSYNVRYNLSGNIMSIIYGDNFLNYSSMPANETYFFEFMFLESYSKSNSLLISAENLRLPATELTVGCYANMFYKCNAMTIGPTILPATTLQNYCYSAMFAECTSLTKAPILPATTLVSGCYDSMFANNTSLQYIKAMFTTDPGGEQYNGPCAVWVINVPSGGTFVKNSNATWNRTGANAVPSGWTIEYA